MLCPDGSLLTGDGLGLALSCSLSGSIRRFDLWRAYVGMIFYLPRSFYQVVFVTMSDLNFRLSE